MAGLSDVLSSIFCSKIVHGHSAPHYVYRFFCKQRNQEDFLNQDATFLGRQRKCQNIKMKMQMLHLHSGKINSALLL